jgi:hypothetical protein
MDSAFDFYPDVATILGSFGQVSEWLKEPVSKTGIPVTVSWVRIPPCPCVKRSEQRAASSDQRL